MGVISASWHETDGEAELVSAQRTVQLLPRETPDTSPNLLRGLSTTVGWAGLGGDVESER